MTGLLVTIDGPSGSGKGTIARQLSEKHKLNLLDSGAIYRVAALAAERKEVALDDQSALVDAVQKMQLSFKITSGEGVAVILDGDDVSHIVRTESVGKKASQIASLPQLREALLDFQRSFNRSPGLVADGRDMGTVVFPDADVKIFLTASAEARAQRRFYQLKAGGIRTRIADVLDDILARDGQDQQRSISPLRAAKDAYVLDSTKLSIAQVVDEVSLRISDAMSI